MHTPISFYSVFPFVVQECKDLHETKHSRGFSVSAGRERENDRRRGGKWRVWTGYQWTQPGTPQEVHWLLSLAFFIHAIEKKMMRPKYSQVIMVKILQCEDANIQICCVTPTLGLCPGSEHGAGVLEDGVHVQGGNLLQGHSSAEGSGGGVGQEVQEGRHTGYRRRSQ